MPKEEEYLYSIVVNSGCLSPLPRVPGSTSNLPQKTLGMVGDCLGFAMVEAETYFLIEMLYLALGCKPQATLHVHYTGNMQLIDAPCPEKPSLHRGCFPESLPGD